MSTLGMDFPQRETQFSATDAGFLVVLKRNCSIHERIERARARLHGDAEPGKRLQR